MRHGDRSVAAGVFAVLAVGLLLAAYTAPWFEYDFSSGRKTAPGGAYGMEGDGVERQHLRFHATHWQGDTEPTDEALAARALLVMTIGTGTAAALLLAAAATELPGVHRFAGRRVALVLSSAAVVVAGAVAIATWHWLPQTVAALGAEAPFTARLDEPAGYTHTRLTWGWYAVAMAIPVAVASFLCKFQAGPMDVDLVEEHAREPEARA